MKKLLSITHLKWLVLGAALLALPLLAGAKLAHAQRFASNIGKNDYVDSSVYAAAKTVTINGTINGDIYCAGRDVTIDATVHGDVLCAGQNVTVKGSVDGNVRVAGQTVTIYADVSHSVSIAANTTTFSHSSITGQDVTVGGGTATLNGAIGRDLAARANDVTVNGAVGRDAALQSGRITIASTAKIGRDLTYRTSQLSMNDSSVAGKVHQSTAPVVKHQYHGILTISLHTFLYVFVAFLLVAFIVVLFFPQLLQAVADVPRKGLAKTLLVGFLSGGIVPIVIIILMVTVIGIPLAIGVLAAWLLLVIACGPVAGFYLGRKILPRTKSPVTAVLLGSAIIILLEFVPVVSIFVWMLTYWIGAGAILRAAKQHLPQPHYKIEEE